MGILRDNFLADLIKITASMANLRDKPVTASGKRLTELSDRELEDEILRRRRARASRGNDSEIVDPRPPDARSPHQQQVAQWYANLELPSGASLDEVRRSYRELMRKYHPDKHGGDSDRQKAANELSQSLTRAYEGLLRELAAKM